MNIILYLLNIIQQLYNQNFFIILLCKYISLNQWAFNYSWSPKHQKVKIDKLPKIISLKQECIRLNLLIITRNTITRPLNRYFVTKNVMFRSTVPILIVRLPIIILCATIAKRRLRFYAKYVSLFSLLLLKDVSPKYMF